MDLSSKIKPIIPNPFSKRSGYSDLTQRSALSGEVINLVFIFKDLVFLLIVGLILVIFLKIPVVVISVLVGFEFFVAILVGLVSISKLRAVYSLNSVDDAKGFREILVVNEYYKLVKSIIGVIANFVSLILIFWFFRNEILGFISESSFANIHLRNVPLNYLIYVFILLRLFEFFMNLIRYRLIKKLKVSDNFAEVLQDWTLIDKKLYLVKQLPGISIFLIVLLLVDIPIYVPIFFVGIVALMVLISITELKEISKADFNNTKVDSSLVKTKLNIYKNEDIAVSIFGIMNVASDFKSILTPWGSRNPYIGKVYYPENTLVITNCRLLFIQVPVTGGNMTLGSMDYVQSNFLYNRSEIRKKGEQILRVKSVQNILKYGLKDFLYRDIKTLTLNKMEIYIEKFNGEPSKYLFLDKEYIDPLKKALRFYLKSKFIES